MAVLSDPDAICWTLVIAGLVATVTKHQPATVLLLPADMMAPLRWAGRSWGCPGLAGFFAGSGAPCTSFT